MINEIIEVFNSATDRDEQEGLSWYTEALDLCRELSSAHNISLEKSASVISAYSINNSWANNKLHITRFIETGLLPKSLTLVMSKALSALKDGFEGLVSKTGRTKIYYFARAIATGGLQDIPVIDRWSMRVAGYDTGNSPTVRQIERVMVEYIEATKIINAENGTHYSASQIQAITWVAFRRSSGLPAFYG